MYLKYEEVGYGMFARFGFCGRFLSRLNKFYEKNIDFMIVDS